MGLSESWDVLIVLAGRCSPKASRTAGGLLGSLRDLEKGLQLASSADCPAENLQPFRDGLVVHPSTALLAIHKASVAKYF